MREVSGAGRLDLSPRVGTSGLSQESPSQTEEPLGSQCDLDVLDHIENSFLYNQPA